MTPENQAKKDYLSRYRWGKVRLQEIEQEITQCRLEALPGAITYDAMPHGSGCESDLSDYAAKLDDLIMEFRRQRDETLQSLKEIVEAIEAIEDPRYSILLRYRYIQLKSWRFIADTMGYSETRIRHLHGSALEIFMIPEAK